MGLSAAVACVEEGANVIAVGNPCRVLREINEADKIYYYKKYKVDTDPQQPTG